VGIPTAKNLGTLQRLLGNNIWGEAHHWSLRRWPSSCHHRLAWVVPFSFRAVLQFFDGHFSDIKIPVFPQK
jgi:hypothetical protein